MAVGLNPAGGGGSRAEKWPPSVLSAIALAKAEASTDGECVMPSFAKASAVALRAMADKSEGNFHCFSWPAIRSPCRYPDVTPSVAKAMDGILNHCSALAKDGGADRDQTDDLVVANDALYQLSYCPVHRAVLFRDVPACVKQNGRAGEILRKP
jgi:hypothetical protein